MSEWAHKECEVCGKIVYLNHTCKQWNSNNCTGDPWGERQEVIASIEEIESKRECLIKQLSELSDKKKALDIKLSVI